MKKIKKTLFTLNVDGYSPEITKLTYPFLKYYAHRIGAEFYIINERKFLDYPVTYEKLQIFELGRIMDNDWNIYIDSDALVHPETIDFTEFINKDTVLHNGYDMANVRWKYDEYFKRDGRNIGSCNWFTIASDWCLDLWHPLGVPAQSVINNIMPTVEEKLAGITPEHLIDDYTLSHNIARFGLKFKAALEIQNELGLSQANFFHHAYVLNEEEKIKELKTVIKEWKVKI